MLLSVCVYQTTRAQRGRRTFQNTHQQHHYSRRRALCARPDTKVVFFLSSSSSRRKTTLTKDDEKNERKEKVVPVRIPPRVFSELTSGPSEEFSQSVAGAFLPIRGTGVVENVREDGVVARDSSWNGVKRHREGRLSQEGELHVDRADAGSGENVFASAIETVRRHLSGDGF